MRCPKCGCESAVKFGTDRKGNQRFRCEGCRKTFGAPRALAGRKTTMAEAVSVLKMLLEGMSVRSCERLTSMASDTILSLVVEVGESCQRFMEANIVKVPAETVECDDPGETVSLTVKVIDACPTGLTSSCCQGTPNWNQYSAFGLARCKMCVTGGTPPTPPGNWDGLQVSEVVTLNAADTTCAAGDLVGVTAAQYCAGSATFTVGLAGTTSFGCSGTAASGCFYDKHESSSGTGLRLKIENGPDNMLGTADDVIHGPCDIVCDQVYFCKDQATPFATFKIKRTLKTQSDAFTRNVRATLRE